MKISMVSEHASPLAALGEIDAGGQNVHVAELSSGLVRAGHDVTVYTRRDSADAPAQIAMPGGYRVVPVPAGPARYVPRDELLPHLGEFTRFLRQRWEQDPPDVVHAHFWMSGLASLMAARAVGVPVVQTFHALGVVKRRHQGALDTSPAERIGLERLIGRNAARVAATCSDEVFELVRLGLPRSRISVVPCGVDLSRFTTAGPRNTRDHRYRIVAVGRLVPRKGFDVAIAALRTLPEVELVIAGGPDNGRLAGDPEARRLRGYAAELGVQDRVRLVGQLPRGDMPSLLRSADVVVCTPWYEPFGIVPLEAMACGVPVVASAVGGLTDTVVDGVTGVHVPPRRPDAVAAAVRRLLSDAALRDAYGIAGADRARCRYSWDRIASDTTRVYERTVPAPVASAEGIAANEV
ncbi:glycosyltransferase [Saccharomonospora piscinae]|uniref:Glycosyl transferase n=1 Tax=Saccharomonospora piscinae TaxID=687388 RepID=A0A1V8ZXA2_SACPI|nr:glycosyltransferase [Saccharomonospora piscinae]OQO89396.1 glycosyl transferase [Saccharomonospora piscinae]TLW91088.1 glycosyltransferase family 1 protein [Saccharomonospora piscinae]